MRTLGIDIGSRYVKFARYDHAAGTLEGITRTDTVDFYRTCRTDNGGVDITRLPEFADGLAGYGAVVSTGYGRYNVAIEGATVISEIKAHARGAAWQTGLSDFTLIDLGGQDTKVVKVEAGAVADFVMNDKCAAGSGRYLENIATMLRITPEELARHYAAPEELSVTCAIFGESEVIGKLAEGARLEDICAGANLSVARRVAQLAAKYPSDTYVVTGGVARNGAVVRFLEERCGGRVTVPEEPGFNGAIGGAVAAAEKLVKSGV